MWEKWVFLATLAGMTCLMRAPAGPILEADEGELLMLELFAECVAIAAASGYAPRPEFVAANRAALTQRGSRSPPRCCATSSAAAAPRAIISSATSCFAPAKKAVAAPLLRVARAHLQVYEASRAHA